MKLCAILVFLWTFISLLAIPGVVRYIVRNKKLDSSFGTFYGMSCVIPFITFVFYVKYGWFNAVIGVISSIVSVFLIDGYARWASK
jgi:hypothetical protein